MADLLRGIEILVQTFTASGGTIPAGRFINYDGTIGTADAAAMGVCRDTVSVGKVGDCIMLGTAYVETSENLSVGNPVATDTNGYAKLADDTEVVNGRALQDTNSGDFCLIYLLSK